MEMLGLGLAILIGLSLGLLGGGGSILTVPILVYAVGLDPKAAVAASLAVVGVTSLVGALGHWRAGNVRLRTAAVFGGVAMVGAFVGARLSVFLSGQVQLVIFAIVMLVAAAFMLRGREPATASSEGDAAVEPRILPLVLQCQSGTRSAIGAGVLQARGFTNVSNLLGGFAAWRSAGHPIVSAGTALPETSAPPRVVPSEDEHPKEFLSLPTLSIRRTN